MHNKTLICVVIFGRSSVTVSTDCICRVLFVPYCVICKGHFGPGNNALHSAESQMGRDGKKRSLVSK